MQVIRRIKFDLTATPLRLDWPTSRPYKVWMRGASSCEDRRHLEIRLSIPVDTIVLSEVRLWPTDSP